MKGFSSFFLMDTEAAKRYAVKVLGYFESADNLVCREIGDGNINYVFRLSSESEGKSLLLKQADRLLRSSGRPLDKNRSKLEAEALSLEYELCPGFVPELISYDDIMHVSAMEDISEYKNLRKVLMDGIFYPHLAENLSEFLSGSLLPTTDLVIDSSEKKERVKFFTNPALCDITEDLVLSEPYMEKPYRERNKNIISPGNEDFVKSRLYENEALKAEAAVLRLNFMNNAQALLHGDLHIGSIFANEKGIKIIDPEFAFYGPMGYDIGNVIGNLFFSLAYTHFIRCEDTSPLKKCISDCFELTFSKLSSRYESSVSFPLYKNALFKSHYLSCARADSLGYAGTELIRRTVGDSKVAELSTLPSSPLKLKMERTLIGLGEALILKRGDIQDGEELISLWEAQL